MIKYKILLKMIIDSHINTQKNAKKKNMVEFTQEFNFNNIKKINTIFWGKGVKIGPNRLNGGKTLYTPLARLIQPIKTLIIDSRYVNQQAKTKSVLNIENFNIDLLITKQFINLE
ncbi:hypothetical protein BpHYR1_015533 [Brachionus plicatilis]|uniref:Uncharacterized protein n=1 Tax=Brachionus plicatilis TaxID=10195 RepID=A0A3M7PPK8_BRAPC|nr:hypothetical protein BpHYR1_015533 [Brachionus plicatilis]